MSNLKIFSENIKINNKRVIVRLDLNVPISKSSIEDSTRIEMIEPFINQLIEKKAKIILISHLGRPKGKVVKELSFSRSSSKVKLLSLKILSILFSKFLPIRIE